MDTKTRRKHNEVCINVAFNGVNGSGDCILGKDCICAKNEEILKQWDEEEKKRTLCPSCPVPINLHGTSCGWDRARVEVMDGIIVSRGHPGEGKKYDEWTGHDFDLFDAKFSNAAKWVQWVADFHEKFNVPIYDGPTLPTTRRAMFRANILLEEVRELQQAMYDGDYALIADGIVDCIYVLIGTAHEHGLGFILPELFAEVQRSNMSKLGADGKPVLREDGKVLKGPNFTPPDLESIIDKYLKNL